MNNADNKDNRHMIWSNRNLDIDDWREGYAEFLEGNNIDADPNDEQAIYKWMEETNNEYLNDERENLNIHYNHRRAWPLGR